MRDDDRRIIDTGRLWSGGLLAGVVGAGLAVVGLLIVRGILDIPVLVPSGEQLVTPSTWWYAGAAFLGALLATALMHVLLATAPRPYQFFGWIFGLAVAIAALVPLTTGAPPSTRIAVSALNLVIGVCVGSIVSGVGRSAARFVRASRAATPAQPMVVRPFPVRDEPPDW